MGNGQFIKDSRKVLGWSQAELARRCDVSNTYISEIENGNKKPSFEVLEKISLAFDLPLSYMILINEDGVKDNETLKKEFVTLFKKVKNSSLLQSL
jgi:transcriptional regulator with XRE-family HTH domain